MKKNILSILSLFCLLGVSGCGNNESSPITNSSVDNSLSTETITSNSVTSSVNSNTVEYSAQVLLPDGSNANAGLTIQWCGGPQGLCRTADTDANGVAKINLEAYDYDVHVLNCPEEYTCELGLVATSNERAITITLIELKDVIGGEGTSATPYSITSGAYNVTLEKGGDVQYFAFSSTEVGSYSIESLSSQVLVDPNVSYYGTSLSETAVSSDDNGGYDKNFKLTFEVNSNEIYYFGVSATGFSRAKTFSFIIKKI